MQSIIYYAVRSPKLDEWLAIPSVQEALRATLERNFADLDPIFNHNLDEDYDFRAAGISRLSFCMVYMKWIQYCHGMRTAAKTPTAVTTNNSATNQTTQSHSGLTPPQQQSDTSGLSASRFLHVSSVASASGPPNSHKSRTSPRASVASSTGSAPPATAAACSSTSSTNPLAPAAAAQRTPSPRAHKRRSRSEKSPSSASNSSAAATGAKRQHRHHSSSSRRRQQRMQQQQEAAAAAADQASSPTASDLTANGALVSVFVAL